MIHHSPNLYKEVLKYYGYEKRDQKIYGDAILSKMEYSKGSKECQFNKQGDEDHI